MHNMTKETIIELAAAIVFIGLVGLFYYLGKDIVL